METKETTEFVFSPTGEPDQLWVLSKDSGETYRVDLKDFICSCADYKWRHAKGDRLCKHLKAAAEAYEVETPKEERLPAIAEGHAITISQEQIMQELSTELRDEMLKNYVYAVADYYRKQKSKTGKEYTIKKPGWIQMTATGVEDLAHMVADRYGAVELGEFRFMDSGDRWIAWRDIKLGNFTTTGFADCPKDREFPFRYLGTVVMRNAYRAIVPQVYQDMFTNKFKEMMRGQLAELIGPEGEKRLGKPIDQLTDGELAYALEQAQKGKLQLAPPKPKPEEEVVKADEAWAEIEREAEVVKTEAGATALGKEKNEEPVSAAAPANIAMPETGVPQRTSKPKRDPETITSLNGLLAACFQDFKMQPRAVAKELGYKSEKDITGKFADCYRTIATLRG
jgi:hypothetical protein